MIFQNHYLAKLIAENICKTTICKEYHPKVHNEDEMSNNDFLMLSEKHIKVSIVLQEGISHNFEVFFKLYKGVGSDRKEIGEVSMIIFPASNKRRLTLSITPKNHGPHDHSNKQGVSKEVPLG